MDKDKKLQLTKEKLLDSTFSLMEETDDPLNVTSRQIASYAGVKPSMINYCFGSRENLIYQVFNSRYLSFLDNSKIKRKISSDLPPAEILKKLHYSVAEVLISNPKFTKAITPFVLFKRDLSKESASYPYVYRHYDGTKSEAECRLIAYELSAMMQLIICRKDDIKANFGINLDSKKELKKYIDMRIDLLLAK